MSDERVLVVNADDFGLTPGICAGILRGHRDGVVTSTSALTTGPAFAAHAPALRDSGLPTGIHLCAVGEDPPVLSAAEVPSLVDRRGRFPMTWKRFVDRAARGLVDRDDLAREFAAQAEVLLDAGIRPSHVDSHQNLHLWPSVGAVALDLAAEHRIAVMRVTRTQAFGPRSIAVRTLARRAARHARRRGLVVPDSAIGLDDAGSMDAARLRMAVDRLSGGRGSADLTVHPGESHDPERSRYAWGYSWPTELDALCAPELRRQIDQRGFRLGSFTDIVDPVRGNPDRR